MNQNPKHMRSSASVCWNLKNYWSKHYPKDSANFSAPNNFPTIMYIQYAKWNGKGKRNVKFVAQHFTKKIKKNLWEIQEQAKNLWIFIQLLEWLEKKWLTKPTDIKGKRQTSFWSSMERLDFSASWILNAWSSCSISITCKFWIGWTHPLFKLKWIEMRTSCRNGPNLICHAAKHTHSRRMLLHLT